MMTYNRLRYPHLVEKAAQLYMELGSTHKVAEELGIDKTTAWSYIKRAGIDMSAKNWFYLWKRMPKGLSMQKRFELYDEFEEIV